MKVKELIEVLQKLDPEAKLYRDGGEYKDDYIEIGKVVPFKAWGDSGLVIR